MTHDINILRRVASDMMPTNDSTLLKMYLVLIGGALIISRPMPLR